MSNPTESSSATAASFTLHPDFAVGEVNPHLFGSFVEHMGRCVYTGIYEPGHAAADEDGLRTDVLALIRELGVTLVRYPGGNFVSGYNWEDGVGPAESRPRRLEGAWRAVETNQFGLSEFMNFTRKTGVDPMMAVNLGTRGVDAARRLVEYSNHPGGTELSDLRRSHGDEQPFDVRLWCLGNEMDGPWQIGHKTAEEYGRLAAESAKAMRLVDPDLRLVACGSSHSSMPTFGSWEETVLDHTFDHVDYISCHAYYQEHDGDVDSFLASAVNMEHFISSVVASSDHIAGKRQSSKKLMISFDEWNVWYQSRQTAEKPEPWSTAPRLIEDNYTVTDAVVVGSLLIALLRHCDRVTAACIAQLVNVIAPIMTEPGGPAWRQSSFYPFADAAKHGRGRVLRVEPNSPSHETAKYGDVDLLHATAVQGEDGTTTVFAVNRSTTDALDLSVDVRNLGDVRVLEHRVLTDTDRHASNTLAAPDRVKPVTVDGSTVTDGRVQAALPPLSWNVIRLGN